MPESQRFEFKKVPPERQPRGDPEIVSGDTLEGLEHELKRLKNALAHLGRANAELIDEALSVECSVLDKTLYSETVKENTAVIGNLQGSIYDVSKQIAILTGNCSSGEELGVGGGSENAGTWV